MSSTVPYDLIFNALVAGMAYPVTNWESLTENMNQRTDTFIAVEDASSDESLQSIGVPTANWMQEDGEIAVHIFTPARLGYATTRTIGREVQELLRMRQLSPSTRIYTTTPPAPGLVADGLWSSMIVGLTYRYVFTTPTFT